MNRSSRALAALVFALTLPVSALAATGGHDHHGAAPQKLSLNAGKKWSTDEPLRQGMSSMRASISAALPAAHNNALSQGAYAALARDLGTQVGHIVQNCKLDPKADAQLHLVLEHVMAGIDAIEGKAPDRKPAQGVVEIAKALNVYGKHFEHDGWQAVRLPH